MDLIKKLEKQRIETTRAFVHVGICNIMSYFIVSLRKYNRTVKEEKDEFTVYTPFITILYKSTPVDTWTVWMNGKYGILFSGMQDTDPKKLLEKVSLKMWFFLEKVNVI